MEAEYFGVAGEGVAYHNIAKGEPPATANALRSSTITVQPLDVKKPNSGLYVIGWTGPGEWMRYQVRTESCSRYLSYRSNTQSLFVF